MDKDKKNSDKNRKKETKLKIVKDNDSPTVKPMPSSVKANPAGILSRLTCFQQVDQMLRKGVFIRKIINYIRFDQQELTDLSERALMGALRDYRDYVYSDEGDLDVPKPRSQEEEEPMYVYNKLLYRFKKRNNQMDMEEETETNLNKLFSTTHKEFEAINRAGNNILLWQQKLGLLNSERGGNTQRIGGGMPGRVDIETLVSTPESRQRVLTFIETLVSDPELLDNINQERKPVIIEVEKKVPAKVSKEKVRKLIEKKKKKKKKKKNNDKPSRKSDSKHSADNSGEQ